MKYNNALLGFASVTALACGTQAAIAQEEAPSSYGVGEIVVTAQKRQESVNKVGMSITALAGDQLVKQNIVSAGELVKVVPGFTFTEAPRGSPVFAIRGIGFDDSTVGSASTVALYTDEVPISFPMEARFPTLDLERVEVLKGPQGILFGQNSTAGAINFIAAKPTDEFHAGFDGSFGRFNHIQASGFLSGPLTDTLKTRLAVMGQKSTGWQTNNWVQGQQGLAYVDRADLSLGTVPVTLGRDYQNKLGAKRGFAARWITEWEPTTDLKITFNVNGWVDKSDTQAAQLLYAFPLQVPFPYIPYSHYPTPPRNARSADWDPYINNDRLPASVGKQERLRRDDSYLQASARIDYNLNENLVLTSISSYSRYKQNYGMDVDGTALSNFSIGDRARARTFNQELRIAGDYDNLKFIIGANYMKAKTQQYNRYYVDELSVYVGFINNTDSGAFFKQPIRDIAAFANVDYTIGLLTLHAGVRYTEDKRSYTGCTQDYGDGVQANAFNIVIPGLNAAKGVPAGQELPNIQPGACTSSNVLTKADYVSPTNPNGEYFSPGLAHFELKEDNVSWRLGADFQVTPTTMLYANVSKGYKSGSFPAVNVASNLQLEGVKQELVLAYEAGIKAGLLDRRVQLNIAGFYNDYRNKQLRGRILDPFGFFGVLDKLLNIPKSRVYGAEASLQIAPTQGLNLNLGGTYVNTKVTRDFFAYDPVGNLINYKGLVFPHTPKWNFTASADYETPVNDKLNIFMGASMLYQSKAIGLFARPEEISQVDLDPTQFPGVKVPGDAFNKKAYTTVDAQIGVAAEDGQWRAWIWGKNIFNTYYWNNATQSFDSIYRLTAMPATYGAAVSFRF
ncbi:TonB-dependent receptor [Tsuneonella sp. CC-YZS046]|uniref:TonB-dependent receptor n=1 Tax=Tsuneonella sp. CC-YZS046 TaxID=3042152 RepID=UPI002D786D71|nr:TonB-dependent receptor [Tsuneonella sp. CC-YZS046]WRO66984.1 TonB-dependent receptor [Tsuneonella sp. CC-YZS046]